MNIPTGFYMRKGALKTQTIDEEYFQSDRSAKQVTKRKKYEQLES